MKNEDEKSSILYRSIETFPCVKSGKMLDMHAQDQYLVKVMFTKGMGEE
ncbi:MAG: hypothetical protein LBV59_03400 [Sphingobacterium sp.]|nr:hypothetical protein [Sphingobacterium sp.]MDR3006951.1 hypothetical protein [Sphingobacterium sp.]